MTRFCISLFSIAFLFSYSSNVFSQDATSIFQKTSKSVVKVKTNQRSGSGFFIAKNVIVTNYHVIDDENENPININDIQIILSFSNQIFSVKQYLKLDKKKNLAFIELNYQNGTPLIIAATEIEIGNKIYAIGSPQGLEHTISDGIVSGKRNIEGNLFIQFTAQISPGSSGGPILNSNSEIVGIVDWQSGGTQNLNFAIPSMVLKELYEEIKYKDNLMTADETLGKINQNNIETKKVSSVLLLNGKEHLIRHYAIKGEYMVYSKPTDKKGQTRKMYLDRIYSIRDSLLGERIVYAPDSIDSLELTKIEMRTFIEGEQYAIKHYKKPLNAITGAVAGTGAGFLGIYGLLVPFGYAAIIGSHSPKVPANLPDAPANIKDEIFKGGYAYKAKKIKVKNALIFGGIGFAASFAVLRIIK